MKNKFNSYFSGALFNIITYSSISFPLNAILITYYVLLPKWYTDIYQIDLIYVGLWLALSRVWDAVSDPLCGMISDKLIVNGYPRSTLTRAGIIILILSLFYLFNPSYAFFLSSEQNFVIFSLLLYTGMTLVMVPYETLAIEMEPDSSKRTKLIGGRDAMVVLGTLGAALFPILFGIGEQETETTNKDPLFYISLFYCILLIVSYLLLEVRLRSHSIQDAMSLVKGKEPFKKFISSLRYNKAFLTLLFSFIVNAFGAALPAALFLYFAEERLLATKNEAYFALFLYFGIGFLFLPLWLYLANRIKKKWVWFLSQFINAGAFLPVAFLGSGDYNIFLALISISAIGFGGVTVLPSLIQADIIEATYKITGKKREGGYVGIWSVAKKVAQASGAGIGIFLLGASGFDTGQEEELTDASKYMLSALYAFVPATCSILSIYLAWSLKYEGDEPSEKE